MWRDSPTAGLTAVRRQVPVVALAFAAVTVLATVDAASGRRIVILGTLTAGPGIAAGAARPRAVLAVGAYTMTLINMMCWWPDRIWGSERHVLYNVAAVAMTTLGYSIAGQLRAVERAGMLAVNRWRTLAAVIEHSDDAIVATNMNGRLTAFNTGAERLYGYPSGDMIGTAVTVFSALGTPADAPGPSAGEVAGRIAGGEQAIRYDTVRVHQDGTVKDVSMVASPVYDEHGKVVGVSSVTRDISAQKRAETDLRAAEEKVNQVQRMASLGQLAGGVAHDFNNLLGIMLSFIAFAEETAGEPDVRADLAKARLAGERAVDLTRQLLTFTRQDAVHLEMLDVNTCIAEVHAMLARTIGENIHLTAKPSPRPLMIRADPGQIQQILLNLAVNARDAMPEGGSLIIEATETDLDKQHPDLHPAPAGGRYVRLLVSDTGTGMSPEVAARVFEPFYTTKPKGHGTGLGLATVYGIIAEAGGSINVYSELGIGTTFRVYFPVVTATAGTSPVAAAPAAAPPDGHGRTVLVVEDEPALGEAVARMLHGGGYRPLSADSGAQALTLDTAQGCDLLLTDVIMPEMSGRQLADTMQRRHPQLPVLYMSGYSDGLLGTAHIRDDGIEFIEKPFTAARLLTQIGTMFPTHENPADATTAPGALRGSR
jgi:two-component system cell cycle sensor histidine kinase/response regulator CckA